MIDNVIQRNITYIFTLFVIIKLITRHFNFSFLRSEFLYPRNAYNDLFSYCSSLLWKRKINTSIQLVFFSLFIIKKHSLVHIKNINCWDYKDMVPYSLVKPIISVKLPIWKRTHDLYESHILTHTRPKQGV